MMPSNYLFHSQQLGFRNWQPTDLDEFAAMNADEEVMNYFPFALSRQQSVNFMNDLQQQFLEKGYTYFAVEIIETGELIGLTGLAYQDYKTPFTPAVDIGYRFKKSAWGKGFATEAASRCIEFAFQEVGLKRLIAICTLGNKGSERVMQKIGMQRKTLFKHPKLQKFPDYETCVLYEIFNDK